MNKVQLDYLIDLICYEIDEAFFNTIYDVEKKDMSSLICYLKDNEGLIQRKIRERIDHYMNYEMDMIKKDREEVI